MSVIQSDPVSNSRPSPAYIEIGSVDSSTNFAIEERSNSSASPFIQRDPAINSQLCLECLRIDVVDGSAHHTLEGLRNSARDGCPCCKIIARTLDGAEQVSSEHPEMRLRKYQDKQHLSVSTASETPESNRHKESRQSIIFTPFSLSSLGIDEPMSFMRSDFWGNGSSGEALIARPPYYAKSSISADKRRNMLFYTVYDCKSLERKSREPGKVVRRLELCRIRGMYGNPFANGDPSPARLLEDSPSSPKIVDLVMLWINHCILHHQNCRQASTPLPKRVLDVSGENPILVESDGRCGKYVLLSHCWGTKPTLRATKATLVQMYQGIPMSDLPKTFYDAVAITRALGVRYLWIDSLCIVQDAPEDWTTEAARMRDYYKGGFLTISALFSSNSHCGILGPRQPSQVLLVQEKNLYLRAPLPEQAHVIRTAPLSSRAWVMQERLLSTRVLHYEAKEVFWECLTCSAREGSTTVSTGKADPHSITTSEGKDFKRILTNLDLDVYSIRAGAFATWCRIVTQYSKCALTYQSDKLPAISGIASLIRKETGGTYIAGIWKGDIRSLLWMVDEDHFMAFKPFSDAKPPYLAPSWSWISAPSSVRYSYDKHAPSICDVQIISHHITEGDVGLAGRLVLSAAPRDVFVCRTRKYHHNPTRDHPHGPSATETLLYRKFYDGSRRTLNRLGPDHPYIIGKAFMDHKVEADSVNGPILECKALWIMRLLSLASLKAQSMGVYGVDSRAPLYCLLVVPEATKGGLKTWKRIGVGIVDGSKVLSSSSQEFVLV